MLKRFLGRLRISTRLLFAFGAIILLVGLLGLAALQDVVALSQLTNRLVEHPLRVIDESQQALNEMALIQRNILTILGRGELDRDAVVRDIGELDRRLDGHLQVIRTQYLGPREDVVNAVRTLEQWRAMRTRTLALNAAGEYLEVDMLLDERRQAAVDAEDGMRRILQFGRTTADEFRSHADRERRRSIVSMSIAMGVFIVVAIVASLVLTRSITGPLAELRERMIALAAGDLATEVPYRDGDTELAAIARSVQVVKEASLAMESGRWIKSTLAELGAALQQADTTQDLAARAINALTPRLGARMGLFYLWEESTSQLVPAASYGQSERRFPLTRLNLGQGLAGECALQRARIVLDEVPENYACIVSGTGESPPRSVVIEPVLSKGKLLGVLEIGSFHPLDEQQRALLDELVPILGLNLEILARSARSAA